MRRKITPGGPEGRVGAGDVEAQGPVSSGGDREKELNRFRGEGAEPFAGISPIQAGRQLKNLPAGAEEAGVARHAPRGPGVFVVNFTSPAGRPGMRPGSVAA